MKQILGLIALMFCLPMSAQHLKEGRLEGVVQLTHDNARYEAPQFSPNGQFIAFTNYGYDNLYVMNADGSNQHRISDKKGVGFRFQWSIDSREIIGTDISSLSSATNANVAKPLGLSPSMATLNGSHAMPLA